MEQENTVLIIDLIKSADSLVTAWKEKGYLKESQEIHFYFSDSFKVRLSGEFSNQELNRIKFHLEFLNETYYNDMSRY